MDKSTIAKYLAGAALLGSIYGLVIHGDIQPQVYLDLATVALSGLGVHGISNSVRARSAAAPVVPPAP